MIHSRYAHKEGELLRRVILRPGAPGPTPVYVLTLYAGKWVETLSRWTVKYVFREMGNGIIFEDELVLMPYWDIDSYPAVKQVLNVVTLHPGVTDNESFIAYTGDQVKFAFKFAPAIRNFCTSKFGNLDVTVSMPFADRFAEGARDRCMSY